MGEPYPYTAKTLQSDPDRDATAAFEQAPLTQIGRYRVERVLGEGGFGRVYLAFDEQLERRVAVKVPHASLMEQAGDKETYLSEARTVAQLNHPHIVPVHDVGHTENVPFYIVTTFVEGGDLAQAIGERRFSHARGAELIATIAEALHYAHTRGVVHCDVKPANILIDKTCKPYLVDFGVARREQAGNQGPNYSGTPAYMSPEQASGEGHRVDGRSDVFSLGIVLYEMLTRRRPFKGDSVQATLISVCGQEPKPPRQIDDTIPKELERICLTALAKKTSERYTTAKDMAEELRAACLAAGPTPPAELPPVTPPAIPPDTWPAAAGPQVTPQSDVPSVHVAPPISAQIQKFIPKGLREFDVDDAGFFLDLLPGPRDGEGVPESIRFWKQKIENTNGDRTFAVGLLYGPTGCGKSSFVRAGLLPRLSGHVTVVYVEATAEATATRLLNELHRAGYGLSRDDPLEEALATLRCGDGVDDGQKVLLVVDQFEQWLHAHRGDESAELIRALRQCNGGRLQALVIVRDDFCLAATRFMHRLEIPLVEDYNSNAVDLFPTRHARKVLTAIGRAYGDLAENEAGPSEAEERFLDEVVGHLAEEGKINSMRLALFAEMMKGQPWTSQSLAAVGGIAGLALKYLEGTFGVRSRAPLHRYHQRAARKVLATLLPDVGQDVRGELRSEADLVAASGYTDRPEAFDELVNLLDIQTGLITPTDPEGAASPDAEPRTQFAPNERCFRLTHAFLVPSLRTWLTQHQRRTRRGRAYLRLKERARSWHIKPEDRQLPTLLEFVRIRTMTHRERWTPEERTMMRRASRFHAVRSGIVAILLVGLIATGRALTGRMADRSVAENEPGLSPGRERAESSEDLALAANADPIETLRAPHIPSSDAAAKTAYDLLAVGDALARKARFFEAEQRFTRALQGLPEEFNYRYRLAPLFAWNESRDEHKRLSREMLDQWETTEDPIVAERTAKACLLLSPPDDILRRAARLARHAEAVGADSDLLPFFTTVAALAEYREGRYDLAIERLEATDMRPWGGALYAIPQFVLAMSHHQSGDAEMARRILNQASAAIDQQLLPFSEDQAVPADLGAGWSDLLAAWTFRREADAIIDTPEAAPTFLDEGHALAMRGEFDQAARYFSRAVRHLPENHYNRQRLAVLLAWLDRRAEYDNVRLDLLLRWGGTDDVIVAERTAKACLLVSASDDVLQQVAYLARKAESQGGGQAFLPLFSLAAALAEYRVGNYELAREKLEQHEYQPWGPQFMALAQLVLAVSHHQSGNPKLAADLLHQASQIIDEQLPSATEDAAVATDLGPKWSDSLICWILRREAEALLGTHRDGPGSF